MRLLLIPASKPSCVAKVVCCACHTVNWPLCSAMICCTREFTSIPCPERMVAGFKLMPMVFSSFDRGRFPGRGLLDQFLRNLAGEADHLLARHLQNQAALLVHE